MLHKGMAEIKQVLMSIVVVMVAAGILTGMVLYSVSLMRSVELEILTGERVSFPQPYGIFPSHDITD
jgi:hypothetical protein